MKCHVFRWDVSCGSCTPDNFYEFDDAFHEAVCPLLIKYVGVDVMNDLHLIEADPFDADQKTEFVAYVPVEHYNDKEFDAVMEVVDRAADHYLGGWGFEQSEDEDM